VPCRNGVSIPVDGAFLFQADRSGVPRSPGTRFQSP